MLDIKMVICVRKDLNMRKGKIAAQVAHASMKVLLDKMITYREIFTIDRTLSLTEHDPINMWLDDLFTKVVVSVNSEAELLKIYTLAKLKNLPCALIRDAGKTEFHGEETNTCCAIGPSYTSEIDKITGSLELL